MRVAIHLARDGLALAAMPMTEEVKDVAHLLLALLTFANPFGQLLELAFGGLIELLNYGRVDFASVGFGVHSPLLGLRLVRHDAFLAVTT
jgi:hypothetical protein